MSIFDRAKKETFEVVDHRTGKVVQRTGPLGEMQHSQRGEWTTFKTPDGRVITCPADQIGAYLKVAAHDRAGVYEGRITQQQYANQVKSQIDAQLYASRQMSVSDQLAAESRRRTELDEQARKRHKARMLHDEEQRQYPRHSASEYDLERDRQRAASLAAKNDRAYHRFMNKITYGFLFVAFVVMAWGGIVGF
jgi:hypothetical protein